MQEAGPNANNPSTATYKAGASESGSITLTLTTSGGSCGTTSANKTITVNPLPTVNVGAAISAICQGGTTVALGGSYGGGATSAVWSDGGAGGTFANNTGSTPNTATYTASSSAPASITLTLTTTGGSCGPTSASKPLTINATVVPSVSITSTSTSICTTAPAGSTPVTFTATPTNGGVPTYQWKNNGTNIGGATSATYTANSLPNGSVITVVMTSNAVCAAPVIVNSNAITMIGFTPPSLPVFNPAPSTGGPNNQTLICPPAAGLIYSVTSDPNVNYNWVVPSTWATIVSGAGTSQITLNEINVNSGTFNIQVSSQNVCGTNTATLPITVDKAASVYAGADAAILQR